VIFCPAARDSSGKPRAEALLNESWTFSRA
jgi:hypothetical protein